MGNSRINYMVICIPSEEVVFSKRFSTVGLKNDTVRFMTTKMGTSTVMNTVDMISRSDGRSRKGVQKYDCRSSTWQY